MGSWLSNRWVFVSSVCLALCSGCYTGLPDADGNGAGEGGQGSDSDGFGESESEGEGEGEGEGELFCDGAVLPGALPNLVRLTHRQYDATVRDLLGVQGRPSQVFLPDAAVAGFDNNAQTLGVTDRLARDYRRAAESLAEQAVDDPERFAALVPCDPAAGDEACAREFIAEFGRRALRRSLSEAERARYLALYSGASAMYLEGSGFQRGIRVLIEAFLQSPHFLYRVELPAVEGAESMVPLGGFEIASRLSYLLWNSMPDDELLAAAEAGELDTAEGVAAQARRLLADPKAADPVADFHRQWLKVNSYLDVTKDAAAFPGWDPELGGAMQQETLQFVQHTVLELGGTYSDLLTSPSTMVNADLAAIYGLPGEFGSEFVPVELDPKTRAGVLTQIGFLAGNADTVRTSPILRGVFVHRQLLCTDLPEPPPNIPKELPELDGEIHTTRDAVAHHTSPAQCAGCHSLINEPGYALEGYDAIGRVRTTENDWPIDDSARLLIDGKEVAVHGAVEMAQAIADSEAGRQCYLKQWFRYANMRVETAEDACTLAGLDETLAESDYTVEDLLVAMAQTTTFRFRQAGNQ